MERIVFLERNTIAADFRRPGFDHEWIEFGESFQHQVVARLRGSTIAISNKLALREPELSQLPELKLIAIAATGSDNINVEYCRTHGIAVSNTRGYAINSVPEHVLMMILALRRNLLAYRTDVQNALWQQSKQFCLLNHELRDINGAAYVDKICVTNSSSSTQASAGPGTTSTSTNALAIGQSLLQNLIVPSNALAFSAIAESDANVPYKLIVIDPSGKVLGTVNSSANGIASVSVPVSTTGLYVIQLVNIGVGPVNIWTAATPQVTY